MDKYLKAIQDRVCSICVDSNEKGNCTLNKEETCAVRFYLDQIVEVVHNTDTEDLMIYHNKLKDVVCRDCRAQNEEGNCYLREDSNCSLDRYFSLIVETIKLVDKGKIKFTDN